MKDDPLLNIRHRTFVDEIRTLNMIMFNTDKNLREVLFFATQAQYMSFYEELLARLAEKAEKGVVYLSSDRRDPVFLNRSSKIFPVYLESMLPFAFPTIDSSVVVTTIPDLHKYKVKRSFSGTNYVYTFHSLVSTHMMYRPGAFDYFDTIFCAGPYHAEEIRRTENLYGLTPKILYEVGYYRLEKIYKSYQEYVKKKEAAGNAEKLVLIAPGWHDTNILNTCADELIKSLLGEGHRVVLRPHPMTIKNSPALLENIKKNFANSTLFDLDLETASEKYLHEADVMICDWSGVALEYALGTERPVLFIDLPRKVYNPEYEKVGIEPFEVRIRDEIGKSISPDQIGAAGKYVRDFLDHEKEYRGKIAAVREKNIFNFGASPRVGEEIIRDILAQDIKGRVS